jgi:hypothetical protein
LHNCQRATSRYARSFSGGNIARAKLAKILNGELS